MPIAKLVGLNGLKNIQKIPVVAMMNFHEQIPLIEILEASWKGMKTSILSELWRAMQLSDDVSKDNVEFLGQSHQVYRWRYNGDFVYDINILSFTPDTNAKNDSSTLFGTLVIDKSIASVDEVLGIGEQRLSDFYVQRILNSSPNRQELYGCIQTVDADPLLEVSNGAKVFKYGSSAKGEASRDGIGILALERDKKFFYNCMQTLRTQVEISGHALRENIGKSVEYCFDMTEYLMNKGMVDMVNSGDVYMIYSLPKVLMQFQKGSNTPMLHQHLIGVQNTLVYGISSLGDDLMPKIKDSSGAPVFKTDGIFAQLRKGDSIKKKWFTGDSDRQAYDFFNGVGQSVVNSYSGSTLEDATVVVRGGSFLKAYFNSALRHQTANPIIPIQYTKEVKGMDMPETLNRISVDAPLVFDWGKVIFKLETTADKSVLNTGATMVTYRGVVQPLSSMSGFAYIDPNYMGINNIPFKVYFGANEANNVQRALVSRFQQGITGSNGTGRGGAMFEQLKRKYQNVTMSNAGNGGISEVDADRWDLLSEVSVRVSNPQNMVVIDGIDGRR